MSYFKVYNLVFTAQMIVPRHIPLPSLVLKFPSLPAVSAALTHRAHPSSLLKKTCSSSSLTAAFPSPTFCAITHPSLAVTPGLGRPFPKPVQLIAIAANAQFYLLGSFSDVFMSWTLMEESRTGWAVGNVWPGAWEEVRAVGIVLLNKPSTG